MAGTLAITFNGPFVFSVESDHIDVFAPKCDDHLAGVFWTTSEYPITGLSKGGGQHTYTIAGKGINPDGAPKQVSHLPVKPGTNGGLLPGPAGAKPKTSYAYFHIQVPLPKIIYGMNADSVEVVKDDAGPTGAKADYATGVRLYYDWTVGSAVLLQLPFYQPANGGLAAPSIPITPPSGNGLPDYGDIEFQYRGPASGDSDHDDAISCFENIADLGGVNWWLSYYDSPNSGLLVRPGSDCKALPIIFGG
jgi:hypothetical protein